MAQRQLGAHTRAAVGAFALAGAAALASVAPAHAASPRLSIVSLVAAPRMLGGDGGNVRLAVRVHGATRCVFRGQTAPFTALGPRRVASCAVGAAGVTMPVAASRYRAVTTIHFLVQAVGPGPGRGRVTRSVTVREAAGAAASAASMPAQPLRIDATPLPGASVGSTYTAPLTASGGTAPYTWAVVAGALPAGLTLSSGGIITGTPAAAGAYGATVAATDSAGRRATARLSLFVTASSIPYEESPNWSGYAVTGGPFTSVAGTFTVPNLTAGTGGLATAEWVGIDGETQGDSSLIQAGVAEDYDPGTGAVLVHAWWEILPALETPVQLTVQPGDEVTVTIAQTSGGVWQITIADDTNGGSFTTQQPYSGPATSAEWIVEAPTDGATGQIQPLGQYTPSVTFTNVQSTGPQEPAVALQMEQHGIAVSTPSSLTSEGFTVAYGAGTPAAP